MGMEYNKDITFERNLFNLAKHLVDDNNPVFQHQLKIETKIVIPDTYPRTPFRMYYFTYPDNTQASKSSLYVKRNSLIS